jgi:PP-loop superfamily ATP-utilizing enzyme
MMPSNTELESASSVARENLAQLSTWFLNFRSALIALSSGVDSSVLACIARRSLGKMNSLAVTSISEAFSTAELDEAKRIAKEIDIEQSIRPISLQRATLQMRSTDAIFAGLTWSLKLHVSPKDGK